MATLPTDPFALGTAITVESQPGLTWNIDQTTKRIAGEIDGHAAVRQAVEIILRTERYWWQIYSPSSGVYYKHLVGNDPGYVAMELQRRIVEALSMDDRVLGIDKYNFKIDGDVLDISFIVRTVFGEISKRMEVTYA